MPPVVSKLLRLPFCHVSLGPSASAPGCLQPSVLKGEAMSPWGDTGCLAWAAEGQIGQAWAAACASISVGPAQPQGT